MFKSEYSSTSQEANATINENPVEQTTFMTLDEVLALREREGDPSAIIFQLDVIITSNDSGSYVKVSDYNRWNSSLSTLITEQLQAPDEDLGIHVIELDEPPFTTSGGTEEFVDTKVNVLTDDTHLPPPGAIIFSSVS